MVLVATLRRLVVRMVLRALYRVLLGRIQRAWPRWMRRIAFALTLQFVAGHLLGLPSADDLIISMIQSIFARI